MQKTRKVLQISLCRRNCGEEPSEWGEKWMIEGREEKDMRARGRVRSETGTGEEGEKEMRRKKSFSPRGGRSQPPTGPHTTRLAIGLLPARASPLALASSKVKMATGLWPLFSQWPRAGEACAGAVAPRGGRRRRGERCGERMRGKIKNWDMKMKLCLIKVGQR